MSRDSGTTAWWIFDSWKDILLFIATPLLIVPVVWVAKSRFSVEDIGLFVAAFGAGGHHLPGMMRAYGDKALFQRFKIRFIVAPLFLIPLCFFFTIRDLDALQVIVLVWAVWHGCMQVFGFLRIYDAKVKSFSKLTSRIDLWMCFAWFGIAVLYSPGKMGVILEKFYASGGPLLPTGAVVAIQSVWTGLTASITVAFLANSIYQWKLGTPPSPIKYLAMASSFGFWWFAMVGVHNIILGVAIWEIFHDVQYLGIVWMFNRKRAETDPNVGSFTRFLFRRNAWMVGLYVGLVFAYGYLMFLPELITTETVRNGLIALLVTSTLLHFYFDGFIWKVREKSTRSGLGISGGAGVPMTSWGLPMWMSHGLRWSLFVIPVAFLGASQYRGAGGDTYEMYANLVEIAPGYDAAQNNLGVALNQKGNREKAIERFETALRINPEYKEAHYNLGNTLKATGQLAEAAQHYRKALEIDPEDSSTYYNLGVSLHQSGDLDGAAEAYRRALQLRRDWFSPLNGLAWIYATHTDPAKRNALAAIELAEEANRLTQSQNPQILHTLAAAYAAGGRFQDATAVAGQALALASSSKNEALVRDISKRLQVYREYGSSSG